MELRQLRYFVRIVELGSMSRAATDLFIAQPALSQQLANLEHELGVKLLSRSFRGVTPTDPGQVFYRYAQSVLRLMERLRSDVQQSSDQPTGIVSIGMPTSVANMLATPLITEANARYPDVRLQITEGLSGHLKELVANGRVQMAVLFDIAQSSSTTGNTGGKQSAHLRLTPILEEELFLLSAGKRRLGRDVTLQQASTHRFVIPGPMNATRKIVDDAFRAAGLEMNVLAELDSLSTIKSLIASGLGATILSASALAGATGNSGVTAHRISDVQLRRDVSLCTYDIVALGTAAEVVWDLILEVSAKLVRKGLWTGARSLGSLKERA